jgi:4-alpha-glucanotransferase
MGEIGPAAHEWLELMDRMGQRAWLLPAMHEGTLQALSPLIISFEMLRNDGVLLPDDLAMLPAFPDDHIAVGPATEVRSAFLRLAAGRFLAQAASSPLLRHAFDTFCQQESEWLRDASLHAALQQAHGGAPWHQWPWALVQREPAALNKMALELKSEIEEHNALQFLAHRQWQRLRAKAHDLGIQLIGTLPALPHYDSADVWRAMDRFQLDLKGQRAAIAVSAPQAAVFNWEHRDALAKWWQERLRAALSQVNALWLTDVDALRACEVTRLSSDAEPCWVHGADDAWIDQLKSLLPADAMVLGLTHSSDEMTVVTSGGWDAVEGAWANEPKLAFAHPALMIEGAEMSNAWRLDFESIKSEAQLRLRTLTARAGRL